MKRGTAAERDFYHVMTAPELTPDEERALAEIFGRFPTERLEQLRAALILDRDRGGDPVFCRTRLRILNSILAERGITVD